MDKTRDPARTVLLCLIGGSADAISYLRYGTFVGALTGNTVLLGIDLADGRLDRAAYHVGIVAAFLAAVIVVRTALLAKLPVGIPLLFTAVMLGAAGLIQNHWAAAISAAALGVQNATVRKIGGVSVNTVFITGDLLRLGAAVPKSAEPKQRDAMVLLTTAWTAYAVGAVIGAVALHVIGYPMIVPAALAAVAAIVETIT